jgi:NTE family protein
MQEPKLKTSVAEPLASDSPATKPTDPTEKPEAGIALCLSGGGYRAMVFHLGALWRLNQAGLLPKLKHISSVSGGSIVSALLGLVWKQLTFDTQGVATDFDPLVVEPIRSLASETIDADSVIGGIFTWNTINEKIIKHYGEKLFGTATLQDLPDSPRFVINATNVQTGALWRFSKPYMADYLVGMVPKPKVPLAVAVAASSAFPPVLSPAILKVEEKDYDPQSAGPLFYRPFTTKVMLTDGGVYDNLGLETAWKRYQTVLVSDGGGKMDAEEEPKSDWARHSFRIFNVIDNQVRNLRKRQVIDSFKRKDREGTYWGIRSHIKDYQLDSRLQCPEDRTLELANTPTRLKRLDDGYQNRLINWGFAICDAAIQKHCNVSPLANPQFPVSGGV